MTRDDGRKLEAKAIPIMDVSARLGVDGLRRAGGEWVGPCPICGGREDRLQINPARNVFLCRLNGDGGDQIALVQHVLGCDFLAALDYLVGESVAPPDPAELARRKAKAEAEAARRDAYAERARARAVRDAREIWHAAEPAAASPAADYLAARGITFPTWPPTLRFLPNHPYQKMAGGAWHVWHRGPCMIAAVQDARGQVRAVHQTWVDPARPGRKAAILDPEGKPAPAKLVRGSKKGGAIRLTPLGQSGVLIMGEGIETTASAIASGVNPAAAFWAGVDLGNMGGRQARVDGVLRPAWPDLTDDRAFVPPEGTRELIYIQDGDSAPEATRAKLLAGLRRAAHLRPGLRGRIVAAAPGKDLNDMRMEYAGNEARTHDE